MSRKRWSSAGRFGERLWALVILVVAGGPWLKAAEVLPEWAAVRDVTNSFFAEQHDRQPGDILSKADAQPLFSELNRRGWKVADQQEILAQMLGENDLVVRVLRTAEGRRFMRKVSGEKLIYDRLDRIARESGGPQLIEDLVKLPNGERYARTKPARGDPNLLDLLPKTGSGKRRQIKDYDRPTGRIYTVDDLLKRLEESHARAKKTR